MTIYARSDLVAVTVPAEGFGGCNSLHRRPVVHGAPAKVWALDCPPCEDHLRKDPHWSATAVEVPETHDEKKARENFELRGAKDKDAILTLALARLAGISSAELPESLTRMISGVPAHVPGQMECPSGHIQPAGMKFCGECGAPMHGVPAGHALEAAQKAAEPPVPAPASGRQARIRDANLTTLKALAALHGVDAPADCKRADLIVTLSNAGVTNNDLARYLADQLVAA